MLTTTIVLIILYFIYRWSVAWINYYNQLDKRFGLSIWRYSYDYHVVGKRDFSFLHCVAEYPTPRGHANLERINFLKDGFSDVEIGFSTHEPPSEKSIVPYAVAMGCRIIEKHVAIPTENWGVNTYSCTPEQIENIFKDLQVLSLSTYCDPEDSKSDGKWGIKYGELEKKSLKSLKRGIYVNKTCTVPNYP